MSRREHVNLALHLLYLPGQRVAPTAVTVPKTEEDHPCTSRWSNHSQNPDWWAVQAWWDVYMDGSCNSNLLEWFFSSLHFYTFAFLCSVVCHVLFPHTSSQSAL